MELILEVDKYGRIKEPSLALYRTLVRRMEETFCTFEIEHTQRSKNQYVDALAALGS